MVFHTRADGAGRADRENLIPPLGCVHYGDRPLKPEGDRKTQEPETLDSESSLGRLRAEVPVFTTTFRGTFL